MIRFVSGGRQYGKTTEMIRTAAETNSYIVCPHRQQVLYVQRLAEKLGVNIPFPITWDEFQRGQFSPMGVRGFVIDDLDQCIEYMARGVPVHAASLPAVQRIQCLGAAAKPGDQA